MKNLLIACVALVSISANAHWGHPYPPPYNPGYPGPYYPAPYVTCFAQGTFNGMIFFGTGPNTFIANQNAMMACQSSGQYCVFTGCRF